jgi:hypothetical protein
MATNLHEPPVGAPGEAGFWGVAGMYLVIQVGGTIPIPLWVVWQSKLGFGTGTLTLVFAIYTLGTLVSPTTSVRTACRRGISVTR